MVGDPKMSTPERAREKAGMTSERMNELIKFYINNARIVGEQSIARDPKTGKQIEPVKFNIKGFKKTIEDVCKDLRNTAEDPTDPDVAVEYEGFTPDDYLTLANQLETEAEKFLSELPNQDQE